MTITGVKGFNDILPEESEVFRFIEDEARRVFTSYGFSEIRLPVLEKTELFSRSIGETTDIVEKQMYTFVDRHGESITLRPEGTAPLVRAYIEKRLYTSPLAKFFYTGPMFRYERPQKGRYRQFYQVGAEVLGEKSAAVDAEALKMLSELFASLGVAAAKMEINSLGCSACRPDFKTALKGFFGGRRERLCRDCIRRLERNPLRVLDCKVEGCIEATLDAPSIQDFLCADCTGHFEGLKGAIKAFGVRAEVNPRMVRGLDYYTRTTFEVAAKGPLGSQNAIAAGGRYDGLVFELGGPPTPCFGFAIGIERLALLVDRKRVKTNPLTLFIAMGEEAEKKALHLIEGFRKAGLSLTMDFGRDALKSRMKRANRMAARYVIIFGEDEMKEGVLTVKDMKDGTQEKLRPEGVVEWIAGR